MGSPERESGRFRDEGPQHDVTIAKGFWLFDTPCTQALWEAVMGGNPSNFRSPDRPVENVSWNDAKQFIATLNEKIPGLCLSLPSEAQWECACRAGTEDMSYVGDFAIKGWNNAPALEAIAWYNVVGGTRPVKLKKPNAYGLYDMLGNVWEWVEDTYQDSYEGAPADGSAWIVKETAMRVVRGGSYLNVAKFVRSASRDRLDPDAGTEDTGFRCARVQA
jgi:formylglycine-generating enzyme required for sulfatase activity